MTDVEELPARPTEPAFVSMQTDQVLPDGWRLKFLKIDNLKGAPIKSEIVICAFMSFSHSPSAPCYCQPGNLRDAIQAWGSTK
jgi:hypothetical protein